MGVEVAAPRDDLVGEVGEAVDDGHGWSRKSVRRRASMSRRTKAVPASVSEAMNSSGWCAWSIEPGPQITVERPAPGTGRPRSGRTRRWRPLSPVRRGRGPRPRGVGAKPGRSMRCSMTTPASGDRAHRRRPSRGLGDEAAAPVGRGSVGQARRSPVKTALAGQDVVGRAAVDQADVDASLGRVEVVRRRSSAAARRIVAVQPGHQPAACHHRRDAEVRQAGMGLVAAHADRGSRRCPCGR